MHPSVYIFGWPSTLGGADTKLTHLALLLHEHCDMTLVPNEKRHLQNKTWTKFLDRLGVKYCPFDRLPERLSGVGLAMSNQCFFAHRIAHKAREKGLKIIWSSEMMWHHDGELAAIEEGIVDMVLFTSEFQKAALGPNYGNIPSKITGNYIEPAFFPFKERCNDAFTIGRLSRAAPEKYPEDFPAFYECLELPDTRFRVMAWNGALRHKYRWHRFDERWSLLKPAQESQIDFLHSLDLFVYPLGHRFPESWGRSTVEAMLTGCIPLVPAGHHLHNLMVHGESGFVCQDFKDYQGHAHELYFNFPLRRTTARQCREHAVHKLCNKERHLKCWLEVLNGI